MKFIQAGIASILIISLAASLPGLYYYTEAGAQRSQPEPDQETPIDKLDLKTVRDIKKPKAPSASELPKTEFELGGIIGRQQTEAEKALRVDVTTASKARLKTITGVGPSMAQDIIDFRKNNQIKSLDDLDRIRGIGSSTLDKISTEILINGEIPSR